MFKKFLMLTLAVLFSLGQMWGAEDATIASWTYASRTANTAYSPATNDANNSGARLTSECALTTAGSGASASAFYGTWTNGKAVIITGLSMSNYVDETISLTINLRHRNSGTASFYYSIDGTSYPSTANATKSITNTSTDYTISSIPNNVKSIKVVINSGTQGNVWLGNVTIKGEPAGGGDPTAPTLSSISVKTAPTKVDYMEGQKFDPAGLVITKHMSDETTDDVAYAGNESAFTFAPALTAELKTTNTKVTITYGGKPVDQAITVSAFTPTAGTYTIAMNNSLYGVSTGNNGTEQSVTKNGIVLVSGCKSSASNKTYYDTDHIRYYTDSYLKLTAPNGFNITKVVFTAKGTWNSGPNCGTNGTYNNNTKTWEGATSQLDLTFSDQNRIASIAVTYAAEVVKTLDHIELSGTYKTDFWKGEAFDKMGLVVTAYYAEDGVDPKVVTADATVTAPTPWGTAGDGQIVNVSYTEKSVTKTATYNVNIKTIANTQETAYTTTKAIELISANKDLDTEVYVKGIISKIDSYSDEYKSITYWLDNDAFQVFGGKNIGNTDFTAATDLSVGEEVVIYGKIKKYQKTGSPVVYEFDSNNYLISRVKIATLSIENMTVLLNGEIEPAITTNVPAASYSISYVSDNEDVVLAVGDEMVTSGETGSANITATLTATGYKTVQTTFTITVMAKSLNSIAIKTAPTKVVYTEGEKFNPAGLAITLTYSDESIEDIEYAGNESAFGFDPALDAELATTNTEVTITYAEKTATQAITVNEKPSHTAFFYINGETDGANNCTGKEGTAITFPSVDDQSGKVFVGWVTDEIDGVTDTKPALVETATAVFPDDDVVYYAVFATKGTTTPEFSLDGNGGDFYLAARVGDDTYYGAAGITSSSKYIGSNTNKTAARVYTFAKVVDGSNTYFTIYDKTDKAYVKYKGTGTDMETSSTAYNWVITAGSNGSWHIAATTGSSRALLFRANTFYRFTAYTAATDGTEYFDVEIEGVATTSYSDYCTTILYNQLAATGEASWNTLTSTGETYTTSTVVGNHGTICLPYDATVTGAVVYEYQRAEYNEGHVVTGLVFDYIGGIKENSYVVEAGKAYVYFATEETQYWTRTSNGAEDVIVPTVDLKMVGTYSEITLTNGEYFLHTEDDMFHPAGSNVVVPAFRAYITGMPVYSTSAPVRMILPKTGVATGVENAADYKATKALVNGKLVILRGAKSYNVAGQAL